ncbi:hypothetical protein SpiGrapes_0924 [Sphaerochaeta pleomorpha str. Grapes]|uniref:Uncharacterized protein n=1 Tax=Sphaerochaeta pleomorpha (strain ATCC BAA-1885 / DSM 22778 / Grapes) TaxID=158190 RepID=G8QR97_SPHPG|nr:hypothetical protein [Sphaerochaeta pleomorpha]AEV28750.1 hypothetical protein SpiGrapes_0924 [Sphaerochaeta pleomorpha str. Grapes]
MRSNMRYWLCFSLTVLIFSQGLLYASDNPYLGWEKIETQHFVLVFEPVDLQSAQHVASFADDVYQQLTGLLSYTPQKRIPVVITGRTPWANGYYSPFPSAVFLFVTSPDDLFLGSRSSDWLKSLFVHEVTHYIHLTSPVGPAKYLAKIFGPAVTAMNTPFMNGWWIEGITTYAETAFAEGGRGDSSLFALTYEAPLQEHAMWSLSQGNYQSAYPPSGRIYTTGYLMVDYLMRTYGVDFFSKVNASFAWFPFLGVSHTLKKETGYSGKELFSFALKEKETQLKKATHSLLSPDSPGNYFLPFPTDKGLLGFASTLDDGGILVSYGQEGPRTITRLPVYDSQAVSLAKNGQKAVFSMYWTEPTHPASLSLTPVGYADLYSYSLASDSFDRITTKKQLYQPSLSTDAQHLVAIERVADRYRLVALDQHTGAITVLYETEEGSVYAPQLSADFSSVVAIEIVRGKSALIQIDGNGKKTVLVGYGKGEIRNPRFLDEDTLLFSSDETGTFCLYRLSIGSKTVEKALLDSLSILGAVQQDDKLFYETYTANGYALCSLPFSALSFAPVSIDSSVTGRISEGLQAFNVESYHDYLRFNLFLPLPLNDGNSLALGVWSHFTSLLRKHQLIAQAGYSLDAQLPLLRFEYSYTPGPYSLLCNAFANQLYGTDQKRQQLIEVNALIPVWLRTGVKTFQQVSSNLAFSFISRPDTLRLGSALQTSYQISARSDPKDFFGATSFSAYAGIVGLFDTSQNAWLYRPFGGFFSALQVFKTHQNVALAIDMLATNTGSLNSYLPFDGSVYGQKDGKAKALLSLRYQIPLGLFDQPVPYGGLTAMGLSFAGQSAIYLQEGEVSWEEDVYVSAKLSFEIVMGSSAVFMPYIGLSVSTATGDMKGFVGIAGLFQTGITPALPW